VCLAALAWFWLAAYDMPMPGMGHHGMDMEMDMPMDMPMGGQGWSARDVALLVAMWVIMMVAMMAPAAAPLVFTFIMVNERRREAGRPVVAAQFLLLGYLASWSMFAVAAAAAQWFLHEAALLSAHMAFNRPAASGAVLLAAGLYQWTPLKQACLARCRSPLSFLMSGWREGRGGAIAMGLRHGLYCVGCCSLLMALLFVAGVMNLLWVAAITAFVLIERATPRGDLLGRIAGIALAAAGAFLIARSIAAS